MNYKKGGFKKAAYKGYANAKNNPARRCNFGKCVPQDYVRSHMWYNINTANGHENIPKNRNNVARKMTSDQIAEAQKMAREMVEANPKLIGE